MHERVLPDSGRGPDGAGNGLGPGGPGGADDASAASLARWVLQEFDDYYNESRGIPALAKRAFENRDAGESLALSRRRLSIYSESIHALGPRIAARHPNLAEFESHWRTVEDAYLPLIEGRYEADLAYAFINSVQRKIYQAEWRPVEYDFGDGERVRPRPGVRIYREFPGGAGLTPETAFEILAIPGFAHAYLDQTEDAYLVAEWVNRSLAGGGPRPIRTVQMIDAGFYRNRGAYLVGRIVP